jgi:hypothetical protein
MTSNGFLGALEIAIAKSVVKSRRDLREAAGLHGDEHAFIYLFKPSASGGRD